MKRTIRFAALCVVGCVASLLGATAIFAQENGVAATPKAGELVAASVELPAVKREGGRRGPETLDPSAAPQTLKYYVFQPSDESEKTDAGFPLMLMLHGAGERGDNLELLKKYGPVEFCSKAESAKNWKFFTVAPQCPANGWWSAAQLSVMIDKVCELYPVDKDRVYVTGVSMGGFGTWALLATCPEKIAAAAPICAGGDPNAAPKMATTPIWAFHGDKDPLVRLEQSQTMIDANKKAGNPDAKLTVYPGVGHDSWINAYAEADLYTWLLSKRLSGKPAKVEPIQEAALDEAPKAGELVQGAVEVPLSKRERGLFGPETLDETKSQTLRYLAFQPVDESAKTDAGFPLLIFLHGIGERGDDLNRLKIYGPTAILSNPERAKNWKFFTVAPQCFADSWWSATQLSVMIDKVCEKYPIDKDRVYVTGLSMGGFGTWSLLAHCPEKIAAAAPICGGGDPNAAAKMATTPIWAFHGDKDNVVPLGMSQAMVDANKKAGNPDVKLTVYPGVGHDSWNKAYDDPALYDWLLSKRASGKPAKVEPVADDETPRAGALVAASIELPAVVRGGRGVADKLDDSKTETLKYYVFQPSDESAKTDAGFPLMLMLHGSGERGDDLNKLKVYGPAMYCSKAESAKDWKFFTVAPQCPRNVGWSAPQLSVMIDKLCEKYPIDKSRVYVTGVSMGGYGTWNLLAEAPEKIAAAAPICGGGNVDAAAKMASTPIWAFHGDQDKAVPLGASQRMIDAVKAAGNEEAKLTIYPGVGHNSWINAYAEPELYTWLLSKTKAEAK